MWMRQRRPIASGGAGDELSACSDVITIAALRSDRRCLVCSRERHISCRFREKDFLCFWKVIAQREV